MAECAPSGFELAVALNLSVRNFFDQGLPAFIDQLLRTHQVPGHLIVLEITEREVMADRALARTRAQHLPSLGVKISVDDFGTGFSSLSQLQQLPIDEIKIDSSFVRNMLTNKQDEVIVRTASSTSGTTSAWRSSPKVRRRPRSSAPCATSARTAPRAT